MAHAAYECRAEVAADFVFRPERGDGVRVFAVHVRPVRVALESVDDFPCAAVDCPVVEGFIEKAIEHRLAVDQDVAEVEVRVLGKVHSAARVGVGDGACEDGARRGRKSEAMPVEAERHCVCGV